MSMAQTLEPLRFPLRGSRLIEASAGTGKTFTIAALYLRLILGHGGSGHGGEAGYSRPLLPPEILVVTFTEAATEELRERIRSRLAEAARVFRDQEAGDPFLQELRDDYGPEHWAGCARRLELAAQGMDEAAVHTIHGWCQRMLREHAFDCGTLFRQELITDTGELLLEAVRDYWRCHYYPLPALGLKAVRRQFGSPEDLLAASRPLLAQPEARALSGGAALDERPPEALLADWCRWAERHAAAESAARARWRADRESLEARLAEALAAGWLNGVSYKPAGFAEDLAALALWADGGGLADKLLEKYGQAKLSPGKGLKKSAPAGALQEPAFAALDVLRELADEEPDCRAGLLAHAARWIAAEAEARLTRRAELGFDDLLKRLDRALGGANGPRLAELVAGQFPVALIDEFQDTDPLQYRIFARVYRPEDEARERALLLIGDPKQAIYAFRGADIHTYLAARRATAGRHYTLERNYRSTAALVSAVNRVFAQAEDRPGGAFLFEDAAGGRPLPFLSVAAQGRRERFELGGAPVPALNLWLDAAEEPVSLSEYRRRMAEHCASAIRALLDPDTRAGFCDGEGGFKAVAPADIAVLVRTGTEAALVRQALARRGLPSVYLSDKESVYDSPEAADLLLLLRAAAEPARDRRLRAALACASLGQAWGELDALNRDELVWEARVEQFRAYGELWRRQGVLPLVHRLLADFGLPGRWLAEPGGERRLTNFLHLAELLQKAAGELDGESALLRHLAERVAGTLPVGEEQVLRLESDAGRIKLVTIHKSKGLEYPLVFLPFACAFREVDAKADAYAYHDGEGRALLELSGAPEARAAADRERLQEDLRLLYVALTRARHALWLGAAPVASGRAKDTHLHKSAFGYLLGARPESPLPAGGLRAALEALKGAEPGIAIVPPPAPREDAWLVAETEAELEPARVYTGKRAAPWWIASFSALRLAEAAEPARREEGTEPVGMHAFPRGAEAGVFLHGLFEWAAEQGFARAAADADARRDAIARRCNRRDWEGRIPLLTDWLGQALTVPLALGEASPSLAELAIARPELEFWFATETVDLAALDALVSAHTLDGIARPAYAPARLNGMLKGYIDLVFEFEGRYYLADYKSNYLGPDASFYARPTLLAAMAEARYDMQYALYLLALHRLLKNRLPDYDYERHCGGAVYLFLRGLAEGAGVLHERPSRQFIEALDALMAGELQPSPLAGEGGAQRRERGK
ncbi:MAG: exodeoxyribonuclease V subunit beta [Gammaproteobacteria bacterium]|nr:exodeoxyribonuclease V subunit beta [Gammaproteobacteria bacterium]